MRLEEVLTDAADAAKEAISIRRRLGAERDRDAEASAPQGQGSDVAPVAGVRNFVDGEGKAWHVWEVAPEQLTARSRPGTYAGDYQSGWLAFESDEGSERRRLPGYPRDWRELGAPEIEALCRGARPVTRHPRREQDSERQGDSEDSSRQ